MASIVRKNNSYCVVYSYLDESGKPRQRWESYKKLADAKQRKSEVEYKDSVGALVIPTCKTFGELLKEYGNSIIAQTCSMSTRYSSGLL